MRKICILISAVLAAAVVLGGCTVTVSTVPEQQPGSSQESTVQSDAGSSLRQEASSVPRQDKGSAESAPAKGEAAGSSQVEAVLTESAAEEAVLAHAGLDGSGVVFTKTKLEYEDGRQVYELEFYTDARDEYEYEIDACTGEVISWKVEKSKGSGGSGESVTADQAKEAALSMVPGAAQEDIWEFKSDRDGGRTVYEGKIVYDGTEYEFEIDADTGEVLEWAQEPAHR